MNAKQIAEKRKRMAHDRAIYWKKRIKDKLESKFVQLYADLQELEGNAEHAKLEMKHIKKATVNLINAFKKLDAEFQKAKLRK